MGSFGVLPITNAIMLVERELVELNKFFALRAEPSTSSREEWALARGKVEVGLVGRCRVR